MTLIQNTCSNFVLLGCHSWSFMYICMYHSNFGSFDTNYIIFRCWKFSKNIFSKNKQFVKGNLKIHYFLTWKFRNKLIIQHWKVKTCHGTIGLGVLIRYLHTFKHTSWSWYEGGFFFSHFSYQAGTDIGSQTDTRLILPPQVSTPD
jgi:hypothetical protein